MPNSSHLNRPDYGQIQTVARQQMRSTSQTAETVTQSALSFPPIYRSQIADTQQLFATLDEQFATFRTPSQTGHSPPLTPQTHIRDTGFPAYEPDDLHTLDILGSLCFQPANQNTIYEIRSVPYLDNKRGEYIVDAMVYERSVNGTNEQFFTSDSHQFVEALLTQMTPLVKTEKTK